MKGGKKCLGFCANQKRIESLEVIRAIFLVPHATRDVM
jgi:hypothetical protein